MDKIADKPRFRMFAGPNGSGKSTLFESLRRQSIIHTEIYVSADRIEKEIKKRKQFNFNAYRIKADNAELFLHITTSGLYNKTKHSNLQKSITLEGGILKVNLHSKSIDSYLASFIASYMIGKLIESRQSFCFETVMSHVTKLNLLDLAKKKGYKTYLYFVFTENPQLNQLRVKERVKQGGHSVDPKKIDERYYRSLNNLPKALKKSEVGFIIDNSEDFKVLAEKRGGKVIWKEKAIPPIIKSIKGLAVPK